MTLPRIAVLLAAAATLLFAADTVSLAGKWKIHSSIQGYENDMECDLTQDGQTVSGKCKAAMQPDAAIAMAGKVETNQVTLQHKTMYNGDELTLVYTAKLESADKFSGRVEVQPMGVDGEFTATPLK